MDYKYVARDVSGNIVTGVISATSESEVGRILREKGLIPIRVEVTKRFNIKRYLPRFGIFGATSLKDVVIFARQLATMVSAGIPLSTAIASIAINVKKTEFRKALIDVRDKVDAGVYLSEAMKLYPEVFDKLLVSMIEAGEKTGELDLMLSRWAQYAEKVLSLRNKVRNALVYPVFILCFAFIVLMVLLYKVVPIFVEIFETSGVKLPFLTVVVMNLSKFVQKNIGYMILFVVLFIFVFRLALKNSKIAYSWDTFKLKIPIVGGVLRKVVIARFARTLATLQKSGVSIIEALEVVAKTTGNRVFEKLFLEIREDVAKGTWISEAMKKTGAFLPMVIEMVASGEKTGKLDDMLEKVADFYEEEVDSAVTVMTTLMEPIMLVIVGGIVGTIVVAMYLPIFQLGSTVR